MFSRIIRGREHSIAAKPNQNISFCLSPNIKQINSQIIDIITKFLSIKLQSWKLQDVVTNTEGLLQQKME